MDTLEEMYASLMVGDTDKVQAARVDDMGADGSLEEMYAQRVREYDDVLAANPYGCNQYGHEWRSKHGEGWKPSGSRGEEKQGEKKTETPEERTKRVVVGAIKDANHALEELNKQLGNPPYNLNDPRARAKVNLEHELTRTKERDTEEAAERLRKVTEGAKKALSEPKEPAASTIKDKKVRKIVDEANKFFKESEEAFRKYKNDKRNPYEKEDLLKQWKNKYMDFFVQSRAFTKLRNSDHYITDSDREQARNYFKKYEEEIGKQYDIVLKEIPSFLGK
jgi:hypothetical protein